MHGELSALFTPVVHEVPLASLQDVFDLDELREFDARVRETVENPQYVVCLLYTSPDAGRKQRRVFFDQKDENEKGPE